MTHRRALDHILELVAGHPCGDSLVLRGSMAMLAWVGDRARPPGDIDWVVRPLAGAPVDSRSPYPYVQNLDQVRLWPGRKQSKKYTAQVKSEVAAERQAQESAKNFGDFSLPSAVSGFLTGL